MSTILTYTENFTKDISTLKDIFESLMDLKWEENKELFIEFCKTHFEYIKAIKLSELDTTISHEIQPDFRRLCNTSSNTNK